MKQYLPVLYVVEKDDQPTRAKIEYLYEAFEEYNSCWPIFKKKKADLKLILDEAQTTFDQYMTELVEEVLEGRACYLGFDIKAFATGKHSTSKEYRIVLGVYLEEGDDNK